MAGFLGISLGVFVYLSILCSLTSFGVSFTSPYAPSTNSKGNSYLLQPIWKREYRPTFMGSKRTKEQDKYAMKWKFHSNQNTRR